MKILDGKKTYLGAILAGIATLILSMFPDLSPELAQLLQAARILGLSLFGIGAGHKMEKVIVATKAK